MCNGASFARTIGARRPFVTSKVFAFLCISAFFPFRVAGFVCSFGV